MVNDGISARRSALLAAIVGALCVLATLSGCGGDEGRTPKSPPVTSARPQKLGEGVLEVASLRGSPVYVFGLTGGLVLRSDRELQVDFPEQQDPPRVAQINGTVQVGGHVSTLRPTGRLPGVRTLVATLPAPIVFPGEAVLSIRQSTQKIEFSTVTLAADMVVSTEKDQGTSAPSSAALSPYDRLAASMNETACRLVMEDWNTALSLVDEIEAAGREYTDTIADPTAQQEMRKNLETAESALRQSLKTHDRPESMRIVNQLRSLF